MAKSYRPIGETYSRYRPCLRCFNIRTRTFFRLSDLEVWCQKQELPLRLQWKKRLMKDKELKIYWCLKSYSKPRIFRLNDKPFIPNCKLFDEAEIYV